MQLVMTNNGYESLTGMEDLMDIPEDHAQH